MRSLCEVSVWEVSVHGVTLQSLSGVFVHEGLCLWGSLSRGIFGLGGLCPAYLPWGALSGGVSLQTE